MPTLVIWGRARHVRVERLTARSSRAEIPGARSHVYPDVAHMVSLEKPAEFNRLLADFLAEVDAATD